VARSGWAGQRWKASLLSQRDMLLFQVRVKTARRWVVSSIHRLRRERSPCPASGLKPSTWTDGEEDEHGDSGRGEEQHSIAAHGYASKETAPSEEEYVPRRDQMPFGCLLVKNGACNPCWGVDSGA